MQGAEDMFHRVNLRMAGLDGRCPDKVGDLIDPGAQLGSATEVHAFEDDAGVHRRRFHGQADRIASVQGAALDGYLAREGALFHAVSDFRQPAAASASADMASIRWPRTADSSVKFSSRSSTAIGRRKFGPAGLTRASLPYQS